MAKKKAVPLGKMDPAARQARVAHLASNAATRSAVPTKFLPAKYRRQREMNDRLNAPVVQGSSLSNREVAHQAQQAGQVKYGDALRQGGEQVGQQEQIGRDVSGWYDDYRKATQQAQGNTQQIGNTTSQQIGQLAGAFAAPNTAGFSAENADDATKAASVRKAILSSLGGVQAAQAGNANQYMNTLANVVVPTQKLQGQLQQAGKVKSARDTLAALQKERGAFEQQTRADIASGEQKNVLSLQALGLDASKAAADQKQADASLSETARHNKASETNSAAAVKAKGRDVNQYGYSNSEWQAMSTSQRQAAIKKFKETTSTASSKSPWLGQSQQNAFRNTFESTRSLVSKYKGKYDRQELAQYLLNGRPAQTLYVDPKTKQPVASGTKDALKVSVPSIPRVGNTAALSAALDAVYDGHLSKYTIEKIHSQKYKANQLGVPLKAPKQRATIVRGPTAGPFSTGIGPVSPIG